MEKLNLFIIRISAPFFFVIYILTGIYLCFYNINALIPFIIIPAVALITSYSLRGFIKRPRPFLKYNLEAAHTHKKSWSCPSNHAVCSSIIAFSCMQINIWFGLALFILALITCISRVLIKLHFITDILIGYMISFLIALTGYYIFII